jgi:signal recognition particle subunit SRP54
VTAGQAPDPDFTLNDFRKQLEQLKRIVPRRDVSAGVPGVGDRIVGGIETEQGLRRIQGMIDAMTRKERDSPSILDSPRCRRIAAGAGVPLPEVERFLGQFQQVRVLMKQMAQMSLWREGEAF